MAELGASRGKTIAFWTLFAVSAALAVGTIAALGPRVDIEVAGGAFKTKSTWKLLFEPVAMALIWFAFRRGARDSLASGCFARALTVEMDPDVARASGAFTRAIVNAALGWAALLLAVEILTVARFADLQPLARVHGPVMARAIFAAIGVIEMVMGNAWPRSAPAAARAGDAAHVHRMRRFRGWVMTLNGMVIVVCALTLPPVMIAPAYICLWVAKVIALNVAVALDESPRRREADAR